MSTGVRRVIGLVVMISACGIAGLSGAASASAATTTFNVNTLSDALDQGDFDGSEADGTCNITGPSDDCSLRAAVYEAGSIFSPDDTVINITIPGTISLTQGELSIYGNVTVNGHPSGTTLDQTTANRVVYMNGGQVFLRGLRIQGGAPPAGHNGGGIFLQAAVLHLENSVVTGNTVTSNGGNFGGGIATHDGNAELHLQGSTVSGNQVIGTSGHGGGIGARGLLVVNLSTISDNSSTLDAAGRGGGIDLATTNPAQARSIILTSTISGNDAGGSSGSGGGGGISSGIAPIQIAASTISNNAAVGAGGGLTGTDVIAQNTIIWGNDSDQAGFKECSVNFISAIDNIDSGTSCGFAPADGNLSNVTATQLALGPLALNAVTAGSNPPRSHAIGAASVARDAASECLGFVPGTSLKLDQRGVVRPKGPACDIGSYEFVPAPPPAAPRKCRAGFVLKKGRCVRRCRKGQVLRKGKCVKRCRKGQRRKGKRCVPKRRSAAIVNAAARAAAAR